MSTIGIDIGSESVRLVQLFEGRVIQTESFPTPLSYDGEFVTQSSFTIWKEMLRVLPRFKGDIAAISVAATCSMVALRIVPVGKQMCLTPDSSVNELKPNDDIIMWMDGRASPQAQALNQLPEETKRKLKISGKFIPELGISKLRWLSERGSKYFLVCFELHDWFEYLFLVGGFQVRNREDKEAADGFGEYLVPFPPKALRRLDDLESFPDGTIAMDGSIKGWSPAMLSELGIKRFVRPANSAFLLPELTGFPPVGTFLGTVSPKVASRFRSNSLDTKVINGCIDCYAGWISTISDPEALFYEQKLPPANLSMVAGTSTCFILPTFSNQYESPEIPGIWGPYHQFFAENKVGLYEFGQPATGLLYDRIRGKLIKILSDELIELDQDDDGFKYLENQTAKLESEYKKPISELLKYFFYYGDVFGNRSPFNDNSMSESNIDGGNSSPWYQIEKARSKHRKAVLDLVVEYNLVMEFLCFQTKQLVELAESAGQQITGIVMCGSQGKNARFLQLLADITNRNIYKIEGERDDTLVGKGAAIIASLGQNLSKEWSGSFTEIDYRRVVVDTIAENSVDQYQKVVPKDPHNDVLGMKYRVMLDMAFQQIEYRDWIDSTRW